MRKIPVLVAAVLASVLATSPATATERRAVYEGRVRIVDGDTLMIGQDRLRLEGVDAPESSQLCMLQNRPYRCGQHVANALKNMIGRGRVRCVYRDWDPGRLAQQADRAVVRCEYGGVDLGDWLVSRGLAVPYYTSQYRSVGMRACERNLGLWAGAFTRPASYRRGGDGVNDRLGRETGRTCDSALRRLGAR
jgi:endonuclease YncB( thermonuclease family)